VSPLPDRSSEATIELLEDIVWFFRKPAQIVHDSGEKFKSKQFQAACQRYGIRSTPTTSGHLQTNGKVERLNHELIQRLQRILAEEGYRIQDWDLYLCPALFAFHTHVNSRHGATSFYLQHGVEPVLLSSSISSKPITRVELEEALEPHRKHI
jgi:transposase InsO family protein